MIKRWNGRLLWAIDGTYINIPDTQETRNKYMIQINQYNKDGNVQALSSFLYDVLNEICINAVFNGTKSEKNSIFNEHIKHFKKEAINIYDRLYADYSVLSFHVKEDTDFVIRCGLTKSFKEVIDFVKSDCKDKIVNLKVTEKQKKFVKENQLLSFKLQHFIVYNHCIKYQEFFNIGNKYEVNQILLNVFITYRKYSPLEAVLFFRSCHPPPPKQHPAHPHN